MKHKLDYEITEKSVNKPLSVFGLIFTMFRIYCMTVFENPDGSYNPEVLHTSYFVSILIGLSMTFSFRVKPLNVVSVALIPSVIFTIFMHDIPIWIDPSSAGFGTHVVGDLLWWNFATIHTPIPILAIYMYFTREDTLSIPGLYMMLPIGITWLVTVDDLQNGTLNGPDYLKVAFPLMVVWGIIFQYGIMRNYKSEDPIMAPILKLKSLKIVKVSNTIKENNN